MTRKRGIRNVSEDNDRSPTLEKTIGKRVREGKGVDVTCGWFY
jgi:hypothetical protein